MNKTTAYKAVLIAVTLLFIANTDSPETAETNIEMRYLQPAAFPELPRAIRSSLDSRGCSIPQVYNESRPHNVIQGEFIRKGQKDWAVLCSKKGISSILIFKAASIKDVAEIEPSKDGNWIQSYDKDKYGFSRQIIIAGKKQIIQYLKNAKELGEEPTIVPIKHDGIDDLFVNKASVVHYYRQGTWLELPGSD